MNSSAWRLARCLPEKPGVRNVPEYLQPGQLKTPIRCSKRLLADLFANGSFRELETAQCHVPESSGFGRVSLAMQRGKTARRGGRLGKIAVTFKKVVKGQLYVAPSSLRSHWTVTIHGENPTLPQFALIEA
jgi:hypothetical protein